MQKKKKHQGDERYVPNAQCCIDDVVSLIPMYEYINHGSAYIYCIVIYSTYRA